MYCIIIYLPFLKSTVLLDTRTPGTIGEIYSEDGLELNMFMFVDSVLFILFSEFIMS